MTQLAVKVHPERINVTVSQHDQGIIPKIGSSNGGHRPQALNFGGHVPLICITLAQLSLTVGSKGGSGICQRVREYVGGKTEEGYEHIQLNEKILDASVEVSTFRDAALLDLVNVMLHDIWHIHDGLMNEMGGREGMRDEMFNRYGTGTGHTGGDGVIIFQGDSSSVMSGSSGWSFEVCLGSACLSIRGDRYNSTSDNSSSDSSSSETPAPPEPGCVPWDQRTPETPEPECEEEYPGDPDGYYDEPKEIREFPFDTGLQNLGLQTDLRVTPNQGLICGDDDDEGPRDLMGMADQPDPEAEVPDYFTCGGEDYGNHGRYFGPEPDLTISNPLTPLIYPPRYV